MKTLFALLGLFMFASVSSSDLSTQKGPDGVGAVGGGKKVLVIQLSDNGDGGAVGGGKKVLIIQ